MTSKRNRTSSVQARAAIPGAGRRPSQRRRRAATYVFFLGTAMMVTVIGVSTLMLVRVQRRVSDGYSDLANARFYAQSAIEFGLVKINRDASWKNNLGSGMWATGIPIGCGTFSLEATYLPDGDADPKNDPVQLTGTGVCGQATHYTSVTVLVQGKTLATSPGSWKQVVN